MKQQRKRIVTVGILCLLLFALWTHLIHVIDVAPAGETNTNVGFSTINTLFHQATGVHMPLYIITDWLGLVPLFVCFGFGILGLCQLVKRKSLAGVDFDIRLLGVYYIIVILAYLIFEMIPINYRPILINGFQEVSYPSSTTLLVLSVMPTLRFQICRRTKSHTIKQITCAFTLLFSLFMVLGRLVSGVHWLSDIVGSILLSAGLFNTYIALVFYNEAP